MKKVYDLDELRFDKKAPANMEIAGVKIHLKYNDLKKVIQLIPKVRKMAMTNI